MRTHADDISVLPFNFLWSHLVVGACATIDLARDYRRRLPRANYPQAEADFTRAIECQPLSADAYAQRGLVLLIQGRTSQAQMDFDHCLTINKYCQETLVRMINEVERLLAGKH
jgi:tetratricopeptide (TPR) repeat protein